MKIYIFQMTNMTWPKNRKKVMIDDDLEDDVYQKVVQALII